MHFRIAQRNTVTSNGSLVYRPGEFSFDVIPAPPSGFTSILVDDLNLEIDETGKVVSVWGLCPHTRWTEAVLVSPQAAYGDLVAVTDKPFQRGVSRRLTPEKEYLPVFVDRNRGCVKVQGTANPKAAVVIMPGVIIEIGQQGEFCALWLHPQSGITGNMELK